MLLTRAGPPFLISIYFDYKMAKVCKIIYKIIDVQWNELYSTVELLLCIISDKHFHRLNKNLNKFLLVFNYNFLAIIKFDTRLLQKNNMINK